jgi:hypothetical protein
MKKVLAKSLALVFVGSLLMSGSAMALPTSADYWTLTDLTTGTDGESTEIKLASSSFVGEFGFYSVDDYTNPTSVAVKFSVFSYPGTFVQSVYFKQDAGNTLVSLDNVWNGANDVAFSDVFGFYFKDTAATPDVTYYSDAQFNNDAADHILIDWNGVSLATISLDVKLDGTLDPMVLATDVAPVPEPATMLLFGSGLAGLAGYGRRKARKK